MPQLLTKYACMQPAPITYCCTVLHSNAAEASCVQLLLYVRILSVSGCTSDVLAVLTQCPAHASGAFTLAMWLKRKLHQYCLSSCMKGASQSAWNAAWIGMEFVLDAR